MACYTRRVLTLAAKGALPVNMASRSVFRTGRPGSRRLPAGAASVGDAEAVVAGVARAAGLLFPPPPRDPLPCPKFQLGLVSARSAGTLETDGSQLRLLCMSNASNP
jgi:hypothetical protein